MSTLCLEIGKVKYFEKPLRNIAKDCAITVIKYRGNRNHSLDAQFLILLRCFFHTFVKIIWRYIYNLKLYKVEVIDFSSSAKEVLFSSKKMIAYESLQLSHGHSNYGLSCKRDIPN